MHKKIYIIIFLFLTYCILTHSSMSLAFASTGLRLWFENMIPALLPFMILSGTLIRLGLSEGFTTLVYPIIRPTFRVSQNACYVMIMGFLCGFPMGAKCVSDLYVRKKITKAEADFLLAFCNNIGPVYFVSFALPTIGCRLVIPALIGMYGLPSLYGLLLRYTRFRRMYSSKASSVSDHSCISPPVSGEMPLLPSLDDAIHNSLQSMFMLGGYMILFNLLMLFPAIYCPAVLPYTAPVLEITGGLALLGSRLPAFSLIVLPFGGLSCIAQTYTCLKGTDLSVKDYIQHKLNLTFLTAVYYFLLRFLRLL